MKTDKELKKWFRTIASQDPDNYYATSFLKENGFIRKKCKCGLYFWTTHQDQQVCGDSACQGGTQVVDNNPCSKKLSYKDVWMKFKEMFSTWNYTPINRYPVVARWNPTTDFTIASIAAFQPYVVSGEIEPPAKKLVIPQFCLRFGDVDNVGITGSHCTGFVMIGQHVFVDPSEWNQNEVFEHIFKFITEGLGLPKEELTLHEDSWAGGGNYGPCMEFFSRGIELFNQVYMLFEHTDHGDKELKTKILDMGLGMERVTWFSQGTPNMYEAFMPDTLEFIKSKVDHSYDLELFSKFSQYSSLLNIDEVENIDETWKQISKKLDISVEQLKEKIEPMTAIYSIAEHTRALLFALNDGALPSNVGGGYNLRVILRRALSFIDKFEWELDLKQVIDMHAKELKEIYPELSNNLEDIFKIIDIEIEKYTNSKFKAQKLVEEVIKKDIDTAKLIELYDSHGIAPETVKREARKLGKEIIVPDNFYSIISENQEKRRQESGTVGKTKYDIENTPETEILYWDSYKLLEFDAKVLKIIDDYIVLDKTAFYPTSGGQIHDEGIINGHKVVEVIKNGVYVLHKIENLKLSENDEVHGIIDKDRRYQLSVHHTAAHVVNGASKRILGNHVWQAGASKTMEKSRLDITHYSILSDEEIKKIENEANRVVSESLPVNKFVMLKSEAEQKYGFTLYQGGVAPGKTLRIVEIPGYDIEACGGTHLDNTNEIGKIKIIKSTKIQDGIIRIEFVAGDASSQLENNEKDLLGSISKLLSVDNGSIPCRSEELFKNWKKAKKAVKKKKELDVSELKLISNNEFNGTDEEILN